MWPLKSKPVRGDPKVLVYGIEITVDASEREFSFDHAGASFMLSGDVLDAAILTRLDEVHSWVDTNRDAIRVILAERLEGWCEWDGYVPDPIIDVTTLTARDQILVGYSNPHYGEEDVPLHEGRPAVSWADLGVDIEITAGQVTNHMAGD